MSIKVKRVDEGYTAVVTPSPNLPEAWTSAHLMSRRELQETLIEIGYHLQDIVDAITFADRDWMNDKGA